MPDTSPHDTGAIEDGPRTVTLGMPPATHPSAAQVPADLVAVARRMLASRRRRASAFALAADIFHEPAWDLLLDLFVAQGEGRNPDLAAMCANAGITEPTALRWITSLEQFDLVRAHADPVTGRPTLRLTTRGQQAMATYLSGE